MGLGASIVIFAIGAILAFGVNVSPTALDLDAIGTILMIVGVVGGLVSALFLMSWSPWPHRTIIRERYETPDHVHTTHDHI
jgi:hypothetical protein